MNMSYFLCTENASPHLHARNLFTFFIVLLLKVFQKGESSNIRTRMNLLPSSIWTISNSDVVRIFPFPSDLFETLMFNLVM